MRAKRGGSVALVLTIGLTLLSASCTGSAPPNASSSTAVSSTQVVPTGRMATSILALPSGAVLEPAPAGDNPKTDGDAAVAAAGMVLSPGVAAQVAPTVEYGLYSYPQGPSQVQQPAWIVWYQNVTLPYLPSVDPFDSATFPTTIVGDSWTVVDASTGTVIVTGGGSPH
jgi:hypothetical protein